MSSYQTTVALLCAGLALFAAGCRRSGPDRVPLHGTVKTVSGDRFDASITFLPSDGKKRPAATASVRNGEYRFDRTNGPTAGPTKIIVRRFARRDEALRAIAKRKPVPQARSEWTLAADVADDGRYVRDFTLEN
jgi:hypothetical protein